MEKQYDHNEARRSFLGKLGALVAGAAVAPSLLAVEDPRYQTPAINALAKEAGYVDPSREFYLPLPDGFEVMSLPCMLVNWNGEDRTIASGSQKLRTQMIIDPGSSLRSPSQVDYNQLTTELMDLGYTHLYSLRYTPTIYNIETFEPQVALIVRGCCLK